MGCLLVLTAMFLPRLALVLIFLLTRWFEAVFETWLWPLLGFIFMPYTTLVYMGASLNEAPLRGLWLALLVVAIIVDIGHWGGGHVSRTGRRRRPA